ncbi:hypothetical protein PGB90_007288 [Kerria lacca]
MTNDSALSRHLNLHSVARIPFSKGDAWAFVAQIKLTLMLYQETVKTSFNLLFVYRGHVYTVFIRSRIPFQGILVDSVNHRRKDLVDIALYIVINTVLLIPSNVLSKSIIFTCTENKYRSNDGSCNNLQHPEWGISNSAYLRLLPYSSDEFVSKLPSIDTISKETVSFIQNKAVSSQLPKTGIFQMWSMLLLMDLDLPSGVNELRNEATAYLDASFLYNPSEYLNFTYTIGNGDLVYNTCESCKNLNSHSKTLILLLVNEHNRIAGLLRRKNPHLDSTSVFEESRKVVIAEIQHITYTQYLPLLLGEIMNQKNGHTTNSNVFNIEKTVYNEKIQTEIYYDVADILFQLMRRNYFEINSKNLSEKIENLLQYLDETNRDFVNSSNEDNLRQILQITRKHKLSTYNEGKQFCQDYNNKFPFYFSSHKNENQNVLKLMYNDLSDAELLVGALTESNIPNGIFGPTLSCIADIQFENIKRGDRFWYSNQNFDASFTNDQLKELKQVTISSLICSNLNDYMKSVQENAFLKFDPIINPRNLCHLKKSLSLNSWNKNHKFYRVLNNTIIKDAIRKAEDNLSRRRQTEYLLYSKEGGADPKSPVGTAAAFSKPNRNALLLANNSILLEYASKELMETLNQRYGSRLRKRQIFDSDDITFSITDDLAGNFLQDLDIATNLPDISRELDGNCPLEIAACDPKYPYRSFTGYCNNLRKPNFGKSLTTFSRILSSVYENGISTPRQFSVTRIPLPSARLVSSMMHLDISNLDMKHSMMLMQLAQFIDHDITFTPVHKGFFASIPDCRPCDSPRTVHPECMPIEVPPGDPYYPQINYTTGKQFCLPFMRSLPGQQRLGHRDQINQNSAFLDLSQVYGEHACLARQLRSYQGRLNTTTSLYGDKDLLPQTAMHPECRSSSGYCFLAGDGRASEQPALTAIHTIFMREHNRLADNLRHLNPHWEDERIFQQARKILVGKYQHILYNEFLPRILGSNAMNLYGLNLEKPNQYFTGYSDECNPSALTEFASAAFRIGHSLLRPHLTRLSPTMQPLEPSILLRETFFNPDIIYKYHIRLKAQKCKKGYE